MATNASSAITTLLNAAIKAVDCVIPNVFHSRKPFIANVPVQQSEFGVLIGITGDVRGRLYISTTHQSFATIGKMMSGMDLDDEMLRSFAAEFTNMVAGHTVRLSEGVTMDISPPTTLVGETKLYGFDRALIVPLHSEDVGTVSLALMIEGM